ncbi:histone H4 transcription factor-like isoform X2 [Zophobas morio]|uniref:histone H4 transcription factor-like isoform X2 n=1 Tax=Zophobas morio TaxID=2755281 RepID=UPI0030837A5E
MCDSGRRKSKHRHNSLLETCRTVKGIFKKDDLDDSLSTSDWDQLFTDSKSRRRAPSVKLDDEPLTLICEWNSCYQAFTEVPSFNKHVKEHIHYYNFDEDPDNLHCCWLECSYNANSIDDLNQHVCFHAYHTRLKSVGKNVEFREKLPECTQSERFVIPVQVDGYHCEWEFCYEKFITLFEFFEHVRIHIYHNPKRREEGEINCCWKGCTSAGRFASQYKLSEHMRIHTREKIIACPTCGNLFSNRTKFCDHRRRQLPINLQSYLCSQCSKYFPSERLLRDHMRLHINHYKCSMCEMTCPKPSILAKHIRYKHLNEKPYKCTQCNYRCVSKHNLDIHIKKHNPDSEFKCSDCDYTCRSLFGLDRHYQKNHGKEWNSVYECHNCKKQFIRGGFLTKHLMKVHNYHWPSGHSRFRYKEDQDGIYRLQTVRYETLDVTEEIIKGKTVQAPTEKESFKFNVLKRKRKDDNSLQMFDIVFASNNENHSECEPRKKVLITIDDIDSKGNVLKSQTIQSSEVICSDMSQLDNSTHIEKIVLAENKKKSKRSVKSKRR